jgi:predicted flap endonuclease-1-like 5' DNA nuclease
VGNVLKIVADNLWYLLGALAGGVLIGSGWRGTGARRRLREQAKFFHAKIEAAIRESDERGLRVKAVAARLAALEPLEGQLRAQVGELELSLARLEEENLALRLVPPTVLETIVEIDRPVVVEKVIEVDRPVIVEKVLQISVPTPAAPPAKAAGARAARLRRASGPVKRPRRARKRLADDLELIHGVGPKLARFLRDHGITQFRQVARWTAADIDRFEAELPRFRGRIRREGWVQSAAAQYRLKYGRDV